VALVRTTRRNIPEDTILHSHRRENLKSDIFITLMEQFLLSLNRQKLAWLESVIREYVITTILSE
jgi:hypothetical protein